MRIGIDVGGTFTDVILIDDRAGAIRYAKVFTTPGAPEDGVCAGIERVLEGLPGRPVGSAQSAREPRPPGSGDSEAARPTRFPAIDGLVHGTTIGTNTLIERTGATTGLITTQGMRDVLEIGRIQRPQEGLYDPTVETARPLVPRRWRLAVAERVSARGEVVTPLDEAQTRQALATLKAQGVEAIAVAFLFSFLYPAHERRVRELAAEVLPGVPVSLSSEVAPEFREFERTSTTVIDAYLAPKVERYLARLTERLSRDYGITDVRVMQASGGSMTIAAARRQTVRTVNSGPAGGLQAAAFCAALAGHARCLSVDMGGTSFDIGVILDGQAQVTSEGSFAGLPVKVPILDVHCLGAGGGSIAWIDRGGALNVGPQSAGADPGPACYARGGTQPTVTDANLVLGRLNPEYFLGGQIPLDTEAARKAIATQVAEPLGMSIETAAAGILKLVNALMVKGIGVSSIEKGLDVREFALVAFGGAGPVHAVELCQDAGCRSVIVPPYAGNLSALGLLLADTRYDFVRALMADFQTVAPEAVGAAFAELEAEGRRALAADGVAEAQQAFEWYADVRFAGQSYELRIPVPRTPAFDRAALARLRRDFNAAHTRIYAYGSEDEPAELVSVRVVAVGRVPEVALPELAPRAGALDLSAARKGTRPVFFGDRTHETAIYERDRLTGGDAFDGPAIIEETVSSTVVPPGARVTVAANGILTVTP